DELPPASPADAALERDRLVDPLDPKRRPERRAERDRVRVGATLRRRPLLAVPGQYLRRHLHRPADVRPDGIRSLAPAGGPKGSPAAVTCLRMPSRGGPVT